MTKHALLIAMLVSATAHADVWKTAVEGGQVDMSRAAYAKALQEGDDHTLQANASMVSPAERKRQVDLALASYRTAAAARPSEGEPYFRIASVLDRFYVCSKDRNNRGAPGMPDDLCTPGTKKLYGPQLVEAYDTFETLAPLDPRFTVIGGESLLFERAVLRTKLATPDQLALAAKDYEKVIARSDRAPSEAVFGNLAETYMMLGRLDEAIDLFEETVANGGGESIYGLAIALDRNGQTDRARTYLAELTDETVQRFYERVNIGSTFFVPYGEVFYYFALIEESRGNDLKALEDWRSYMASGAHPQYQPAAKLHIDAITKRLANRPTLHMHDIAPEDM